MSSDVETAVIVILRDGDGYCVFKSGRFELIVDVTFGKVGY